MRILITGASGNVGCGVVGALRRSLPSAELVGVCRRPPRGTWMADAVEWVSIDLSAPQAERELVAALRDVDVVVHLAVAVHPPRDTDYLYRANVVGSQAVWNAMRSADVRHLVYASSLGVYGPGHGSPVDEHWPRTGQPTSTYSAHKILVERQLDVLADQWPELIQARIRPTVVVQRDAAALFRRLYLGSLVPRAAIKALRAGAFPAIPLPAGLSLQFVHADDVGDVVVALIRSRAQGSFNVAADVLDTAAVAGLIHARPISISASLTRRVVLALARLRVIAVTPGWYDVATNSPLMDVSRARTELGWSARWSSTISAHELIDGLADGAVGPTPATGLEEEDVMDNRLTARRVHDATLAWWAALTVVRAVQRRRPGRLDAAVVAAHLAAGTPLALDRVRERRRDPVAVLAPLAVGSSLVATLRGGWAPVGCLAVLGALAGADRRRYGRGPR